MAANGVRVSIPTKPFCLVVYELENLGHDFDGLDNCILSVISFSALEPGLEIQQWLRGGFARLITEKNRHHHYGIVFLPARRKYCHSLNGTQSEDRRRINENALPFLWRPIQFNNRNLGRIIPCPHCQKTIALRKPDESLRIVLLLL